MDENKVKKGPQESEYDDGEFMLDQFRLRHVVPQKVSSWYGLDLVMQ